MFLFSGLEASSGFSYVVPRTVFTWDFINNITLEIRRLSELWRRKFLLKASTLLSRAFNLPSSLEGKPRETSHARTALEANGYPSTVISNILNKKPLPSTVPPPEELFFKWAEPLDTYQGFACLPYISGLTEPLTRLLRNSEIRVVNKPFKTLQQEFPSPKFRQPPDLQCNVVDKIPCKDCPWNYIGETVMCRVQYP